MFYDVPINEKSEDKLHRMAFVNSLAQAINNSPSYNESIVIGLMGKWGSGKSSIINLLESELDERVIVLRFNPWNYPPHNQLIFSFFDELSTTLDKYDFDGKIKIFLSKYKSKMLDRAIDIGSSYFQPIKFISIFNKNDEYETLDDIKNSLKELFKNQKKILVIIDDIDRLNPNEIKEIFQLVKSLADFPNIIYLMAFDKDYVNFALKDWNVGSKDYSHSEDFIDKIVQIPLSVPKLDSEDLFNVFSSKFDEIINHYEIDFYIDRNNVYNLINPLIRNIRDLNRFFNTLNFSLGSIKDINFYDFILITALQVFEKDIYDEIKHNKDLITGDFDDYEKIKILHSDSLENLKTFIEILLKKVKTDERAVKLILSDLFPKVSFVCFERSIEQDFIDEKIKKASVFSQEYFDLYFTFYIRKNTLSLSRIESIILSSKDKEEFKSNLILVRNLDLIIKLFDILRYHIDKFNKENVKNVLEVILNDFDELFKKDDEDISDSLSSLITQFILDLSELYDNEREYKNLLKTVLFESEDSYFKIFLINHINLNKFFDETETQDLNIHILSYINDLFKNNIKSISNLKEVITFWNFFSITDEVNTYIRSLSNNDLIYLIESFSYPKNDYIYFDIFQLNHILDIDYINLKFLRFKNEEEKIYLQNKIMIDSFLEDYSTYIKK